ncbi:hypothetical protein BDQ17DRAFT_1336718 [Cyathus striatus]|nr:hypothetical protein BDQ17DRAFT_1336718 [Cyathus striatus]
MPVSILRDPHSSLLRSWWYRHANNRRNIYCISLYVLITLSIVIAGLTVGIKYQVKDFKGVSTRNSSSLSRTVYLEADLISVDPLASTMLMNWYIGDDSCFYNDDPESCTPVNIYFDINLLQLKSDDSDVNRNNLNESEPIFIWYPDQYLNNALSDAAVFRTTSWLFDNGTRKSVVSVQYYPFDIYAAVVFVYGMTNGLTPILISGFESKSNIYLFDGSLDGVYWNAITLKRSSLIKAYVVSIVIGVSTKCLMRTRAYYLGIPWICNEDRIRLQSAKEVLAVPIATLFAFTSLRGTMPNAPLGFGAIMGDYFAHYNCHDG